MDFSTLYRTKVTGYGYRSVRVVPIITIEGNWREPSDVRTIEEFHHELAKKANIHIDNHQTFFLDEKICVRFDDYNVHIALVADSQIGSLGIY